MDHYTLIAPIYDYLVYFIRKPNIDCLRDLLRLPTPERMLDAGGGTGRVSALLRPFVGQIVVSDLSRSMLRRAQVKGGILPVQARADLLPFPEACFERVLVVDAFHHFWDKGVALRELSRVLKPGGRLVIEEQDIRRFPIKVIAWAEKLALMRSRFFSSDEIADMIKVHGHSVSIERDGRFLFWVVAEKR
jgi:demethylmenaquinone methyltransferase/2-methoxy-6-polyprenyl-1,4-benzoquinol methylase